MVVLYTLQWPSALQDSILGLLLFFLYINDLPHNLISCVKMFTDDVALYHSVQQEQYCPTL